MIRLKLYFCSKQKYSDIAMETFSFYADLCLFFKKKYDRTVVITLIFYISDGAYLSLGQALIRSAPAMTLCIDYCI